MSKLQKSKPSCVDMGEKIAEEIKLAFDLSKEIEEKENILEKMKDEIKEVCGSKISPDQKSINVQGKNGVGAQITIREFPPTIKNLDKAREIAGLNFPIFFDESATSTKVICKVLAGKEQVLCDALKQAGLDPSDFVEMKTETTVEVKSSWKDLTSPNSSGVIPIVSMLGVEKATALIDVVKTTPNQIAMRFIPCEKDKFEDTEMG